MILRKHIPNKPDSACGLVQTEMTPKRVRGIARR